MVIFGWGPDKQDDEGEVAACVCPNCHNQVFLHHVRSKKSVRLYFVPVVPYGTDDYLVCPVCSRGLQLSSAQLPHVRSMSSATAAFRHGRLAPAQYTAQVERFWRQLGINPAGQQIIAPASPGAMTPAPPPAAPPPAAPPPAAPPPAAPPPAAPPPAAPPPAAPPPAAPPPAAPPPAAPPPAAPPPSAGRPVTPARPAAPAQPPPAAGDDQTSWIAQLRKLARLHDQGVLSDAAYEAAKRRVLEQK